MPAGPPEIVQPGFAARSGFVGALLYYLLVTVGGVLTPKEGRALVIVLYVAHGLISDISGRPCVLPVIHPATVAAGCVLHGRQRAVKICSQRKMGARAGSGQSNTLHRLSGFEPDMSACLKIRCASELVRMRKTCYIGGTSQAMAVAYIEIVSLQCFPG